VCRSGETQYIIYLNTTLIFCCLFSFRAAIEYEKKGFTENYEHGQVMEKKLVAMAREMEKLRAEIANAEKRARATAAVTTAGNPGIQLRMFVLIFALWNFCWLIDLILLLSLKINNLV